MLLAYLHAIHLSDFTSGNALRNNMQPNVCHQAVECACTKAAPTTCGLYSIMIMLVILCHFI